MRLFAWRELLRSAPAHFIAEAGRVNGGVAEQIRLNGVEQLSQLFRIDQAQPPAITFHHIAQSSCSWPRSIFANACA